MDRRAFLAGAASVTLLTAVRSEADAAVDPRLLPFAHGVASGDPLPDGVVLWTRITGGPATVPVRWLVAEDPQLRRVVRSGTATASAQRDRTVKVDVRGLQPFRTYWYAFEALGKRSMVGRTKTAPARRQDVQRLRFAVTSCAKYDQGYFNAYARIAEADVDAVLHLGDYIYESGTGSDVPRATDPGTEVRTLAEYRRRYAHYRTDPDLQRLHQTHPVISVWDDHESANDSWAGGAPKHDPAVFGPWAVRKAAAQRVYDEWMPIRLPEPGNPARIHRQLAYGDLADLVCIDTRMEGRSEQLEGLDGDMVIVDPRTGDPARQMYSPKQRAFIESALTGSRASWKLLLNQVLISQLKLQDLPDDVSAALGAIGQTGLPTEGVNLASDIWDGYEAERERLLGFVRDKNVRDLVVLTGDIHCSWANELAEDHTNPLTPPVAVELVCTSVTSTNFDEALGVPPRTTSLGLEAAIKTQNPGTKYVELDSNGWLLVDVTGERLQGDYLFVGTVAERSTAQRVDASWVVTRGAARLAQAAAPTAARPDRPAQPAAPAVTPVAQQPRTPGPGLPATGARDALPWAGAAVLAAAWSLRRAGPSGD